MRIAPKLALVAYVHSTQSGGETGEDGICDGTGIRDIAADRGL